MNLRPIEELIEELDEYTGVTKHDLVDEAVARQEEITPHLLMILEEISADPEVWMEDGHDITTYVLVLLCHFKEPRAHGLVLNLFNLPEPKLFDLFGDFIGENLPALLINTCGGNLEGVRQLILNRNASAYCRWSACSALAYAVVAGMADRDEVVAFLKTLLTGDEAQADKCFWDGVVSTLIELHPGDALAEIRAAYDAGLVYDDFASFSYIEDKAAMDKTATLEDLREQYERNTPDNIHEYISWWDEPGKRVKAAGSVDPLAKKEKKQKAQRRTKNKLAKKSRRKNR
jgi:hypothetical protein